MFGRSKHTLRAPALASTGAVTCALIGPSAIAAGEPAAPAPSGAKPTIVLVHGAFADTSSGGGSQGAFAARATRVRRLPTGHMPLLSMPLELTDLIVEAAESA